MRDVRHLLQPGRAGAVLFGMFFLFSGTLVSGCGQKQEPAAPPAPTANAKYPPGYVQARTARDRPMPLDIHSGK